MNTSEMQIDSMQQGLPPAIMPAHARTTPGTLLLVEDSDVASDAIRLMFNGNGRRLRRADCLMTARQHLRLYTPDAVIVDVGLPDGSGLDLIAELGMRRPQVGLVIATSGDASQAGRACAAGADHFLPKPISSVAVFQALLLPVFPDLAPVSDMELPAGCDPVALRADLFTGFDLLQGGGTAQSRAYAFQFINAVAAHLRDHTLARAVADARQTGRNSELALMLRHRLREQPLI